MCLISLTHTHSSAMTPILQKMLEEAHLAVRICKHPGEDLTESLQLHTTDGQNDNVTPTTDGRLHFSPLSQPHPPEHPLALEQVLKPQQPLLPLRPVGTGAVVQNLGDVLRLPHVVRCDAAVA